MNENVRVGSSGGAHGNQTNIFCRREQVAVALSAPTETRVYNQRCNVWRCARVASQKSPYQTGLSRSLEPLHLKTMFTILFTC